MRTIIKRICSLGLALCLMTTTCSCSLSETMYGLPDGVYESTVPSGDGALRMGITVEEGRLTGVSVNEIEDMTIEQSVTGTDEITLYPSGKLDTYTQEAFREALEAVPADTQQLILDFRDVQLITSAGLRELMVCRRRFPGDRMRIVNVSHDVMDTFRMVRFESILPVEEMQEDISTYIDMSFKELLAHQVEANADLPALKSGEDTYTWMDIEYASQIIAEDLSDLGVAQGSHVGLCGANSVNWILTFYAIQKLGAMAMLINPTQSAAEIGRICEIGEVTCLCYGEISAMTEEESFLDAVKAVPGTCIDSTYSIRNMVQFKSRFSEYEELKGKYDNKVEADAPCVIIFTSGSTGRPKGVILSAYNLLNAASTQIRLQRISDQDRELLIVPLFHILGLVVCLFPTAMTGAMLVVPEDTHTGTLIDAMKAEQCTLLHSVPTMIIALLNSKSFDPAAFENLRCTILAGATATEAQLTMFSERLPQNHFIIAYGLSEMAPVSATQYEDTPEHLINSVGMPVENISIYIRDPETGEACVAGVPGEVLVQGFNLMTGYYNLPIEDQAIDGKGWLHTGDMGYLDQDNYLHLVGRYKDLIIRGGENIMPAEIEAAISELEIIQNVRVIGVPSDFYGEEVAACVVLKPGAELDEEAVRAQLLEKLAKYKVPSYFFVFDEFPMLGSGKIDGVTLKEEALRRMAEKK